MWFMPSYGRPDALQRMEFAPGGLPDEVVVLVNEDDPTLEAYFDASRGLPRWKIVPIPAGYRLADAHRFILPKWPHEPWYGLLCDDQWPVTPGWHEVLVKAAGSMGFATPAGEPSFPLLRNAVVIGGEMVRLMGSLVPIPVQHNFEDNVWDDIAQDFRLLRPCADVVVEHRHWIHGTAERDATYIRGSAGFDQDKAVYDAWHPTRADTPMYKRIAAATGTKLTTLDPKKIRLVLALPCGDGNVDIAFHRSLIASLQMLRNRGLAVGIVQSALNSHVGKGRETVLWRAMREDATHILFIDSDMGWDPELIVRLLAASEYHDFCGAVGCKKQDDLQLCFNPAPDPQYLDPTTGFLRVNDVGFAFVMLRRSVVERLCEAYPELRYNAGPNAEWALFFDMIDKTDVGLGPYGERLSEDLSFCRRWRNIGGEIYLDPDASLVHAGRKEYIGRLRDVLVPAKPHAIAAE